MGGQERRLSVVTCALWTVWARRITSLFCLRLIIILLKVLYKILYDLIRLALLLKRKKKKRVFGYGSIN